ncbi:MAG: hypothetical protein JRJ49_11235 [Deltaproteobacteria bacterium]|nr:hypothetical protein [Deltaproteobacteria bacterium]
MIKIDKYINLLIETAKKELKSYNYSGIRLADFQLINSFLLDSALNQSPANQDNYSLLIKIPEKDIRPDFYLPVILSIASSLFFKNYIEDATEYKIGDIVQRDGKRYELVEIKDEEPKYVLIRKDKLKTKITTISKEIRKYIIITGDLSKRVSRTKFDDYKEFFNLLFKVDYFPSKFLHKAVIIVEKKGLFEKLKSKKINEICLHKALPFQWVTKKGIAKHESQFIPIEPMIYLVPDYETFKERLFEKIENLDAVIFIGKNKYSSDYLTEIKKDIRTEKIPPAIFIGVDDIDDFTGLKSWDWTRPEMDFFNKVEVQENKITEASDCSFGEALGEFEKYIKGIDEEYTRDISKKIMGWFEQCLYSLVAPFQNSRITSQANYIKERIREKIEEEIKDNFFPIDNNPTEYINKAFELIDSIFTGLNFEKFRMLSDQQKVDILLVSKWVKEIWEEELPDILPFNKTKILTISEFLSKEKEYTTVKEVYLLTIFGFESRPQDFITKLIHSSHNINYILYPEEKKFVEKLEAKYKNRLIEEYLSADRAFMTDINSKDIEAYFKKGDDEGIDDIIDRLYNKETEENRLYGRELSESVEYIISYEEDNFAPDTLEGSKSVLLEEKKRKEVVSHLIVGDKIRVYENYSKEKLFEIATNEDNEGRFFDIKVNSDYWKKRLKRYFKQQKERGFYNEENLLEELKKNGANIEIGALKNWLKRNSNSLYPSQNANLVAIKKTINDQELNDKFEDIKRCKKAYRGIMIALGRDLSDEIMDYVISDKKDKGKMLIKFTDSEIKSFVKRSAPVKTIKAIKINRDKTDE